VSVSFRVCFLSLPLSLSNPSVLPFFPPVLPPWLFSCFPLFGRSLSLSSLPLSPRFCSFFLHSWLFFFSLLCFFEKKQRNESLLVALFLSLYYVCSEGEGGGATGDEVGAPVLVGQCASLFLSLQSSLSWFPWFCFFSSPPRSLIFSGFIATECHHYQVIN